MPTKKHPLFQPVCYQWSLNEECLLEMAEEVEKIANAPLPSKVTLDEFPSARLKEIYDLAGIKRLQRETIQKYIPDHEEALIEGLERMWRYLVTWEQVGEGKYQFEILPSGEPIGFYYLGKQKRKEWKNVKKLLLIFAKWLRSLFRLIELVKAQKADEAKKAEAATEKMIEALWIIFSAGQAVTKSGGGAGDAPNLSRRAGKVWKFIQKYKSKKGYEPTYDNITCYKNRSTISLAMKELREKGLLPAIPETKKIPK